MFEVSKNGDIQLTRGDTARLRFVYMNASDNTEYVFGANDVLRFTVREDVESDILLQKVVTGTNVVRLDTDDTKNLDFGTYVYDAELTTESGEVSTIGNNKLKILSEVTY